MRPERDPRSRVRSGFQWQSTSTRQQVTKCQYANELPSFSALLILSAAFNGVIRGADGSRPKSHLLSHSQSDWPRETLRTPSVPSTSIDYKPADCGKNSTRGTQMRSALPTGSSRTHYDTGSNRADSECGISDTPRSDGHEASGHATEGRDSLPALLPGGR